MRDDLTDRHMKILSEFRDLLEDHGVYAENIHVDPEMGELWIDFDGRIVLTEWEESD